MAIIVETIAGGHVTKMRLSGDYGVSAAQIYPELPSYVDGSVLYVLGSPSVVAWRGSEHGYSGHGLAVRVTDEAMNDTWKSWYRSFDGSLVVNIEELEKVGIKGIFRVKISSPDYDFTIEVTSLQNTKGSLSQLAVVPGIMLTEDEKFVLQRLL